MGYRFQFVTLAGFHALNFSMFELARGYKAHADERLRAACSRRSSPPRRTATPPPSTSARSARATSMPSPRPSSGGNSSLTALTGSTEEQQFEKKVS